MALSLLVAVVAVPVVVKQVVVAVPVAVKAVTVKQEQVVLVVLLEKKARTVLDLGLA